VASGQTPIGAITTDAVAIAHDANPQVAIMLELVSGTPYSLVVDPSIRSVSDLRGKTLGASGLATADGGIIRAILASYGMQQGRDYTIAIAGNPAARAAALASHAVVGIAAPQPQLAQLEGQGFKELVSATSVPGLSQRPFNTLNVNRDWAAKHPKTVVALERAWLTAAKYLYANPKRSIDALSDALHEPKDIMTQAYDDWVISKKIIPTNCNVPLYAIKSVIQGQITLGNLKAPGPKPASLLLGGSYCKQAMAPVKKKAGKK
jgi:ABC-type nitrate/sulfonate/bicarbonate transport system substrate-binding protein